MLLPNTIWGAAVGSGLGTETASGVGTGSGVGAGCCAWGNEVALGAGSGIVAGIGDSITSEGVSSAWPSWDISAISCPVETDSASCLTWGMLLVVAGVSSLGAGLRVDVSCDGRACGFSWAGAGDCASTLAGSATRGASNDGCVAGTADWHAANSVPMIVKAMATVFLGINIFSGQTFFDNGLSGSSRTGQFPI